jgi:hypothetical protein
VHSEMTFRQLNQYVSQLRREGIGGFEQHEHKLTDNLRNLSVLNDLFLEGRAALMFQRNGFRVVLREKPDLQLELNKEIVYAEVKHFQRKEQDRIDEEAMRKASGLLVPIGDTTPTEGDPVWKQIANVAIRKASQYMEGAANVLLIESSSESLEMMLATAVNEYDDEIPRRSDPRLRRLSAFILVTSSSIGFGAALSCMTLG